MADSLLVVLSLLLAQCSAQVTVQVRDIVDEDLLWSYSFPHGFTNPLDWYITPYANLPPTGLSAVLYRPTPHAACSTLQPTMTCNSSLSNLTMLALVDEYHICTRDKFVNVQAAGFAGLITYSSNDSDTDATDRVRDRSTGLFFNVTATGFPTIVVSEQFANILAEIAVTSESPCPDSVLSITSDLSRQRWIGFSISLAMVVVLVGLPLILCCCVCGCICWVCIEGRECVCCSCCCSTNGVYEVSQVQVRVLGDDLVLEQPTYSEEERREEDSTVERYERVYEVHPEPRAARKYQSAVERNMSCAICLECFNEEETVHALSCDQHHVFHPDCIEKWLEVNNMCPVCRAYVMQPNF